MKAVSILLAATCLTFVAHAQAPDAAPAPSWGGVKLKSGPGVPPPTNTEGPLRITTDIVPAAAPSTAAPEQPAAGVAPAPQLPAIPAATPVAGAASAAGLSVTPAASTPDAAGAQLPSGMVPGAPVKTYATLADAAKDGVDPLKELQTKPATLPPMANAGKKSFDYTNPGSYINWVTDNLGEKGVYGLGAGLLVLLVLGFLRSRR